MIQELVPYTFYVGSPSSQFVFACSTILLVAHRFDYMGLFVKRVRSSAVVEACLNYEKHDEERGSKPKSRDPNNLDQISSPKSSAFQNNLLCSLRAGTLSLHVRNFLTMPVARFLL